MPRRIDLVRIGMDRLENSINSSIIRPEGEFRTRSIRPEGFTSEMVCLKVIIGNRFTIGRSIFVNK
jgi:hypothetical protein